MTLTDGRVIVEVNFVQYPGTVKVHCSMNEDGVVMCGLNLLLVIVRSLSTLRVSC